ncbi:MAG: hypothetical protein AAF244_03645 [Pseudomonadota bacterium]
MTSLSEAIYKVFPPSPPDLKAEVLGPCCIPQEDDRRILSDDKLISILCDPKSIEGALILSSGSSAYHEEQIRMLEEMQMKVLRLF